MISTDMELNNDKLFFAPFDNDAIKFIYLGSKITPEHEKSLRSICKAEYPNAQLLNMKLDNKSFNMIVNI